MLSTNENTINLASKIFDDFEKKWPKLVGAKHDNDTLTFSLYVAEDIHWFKGHFPDKAVLPGVAQVHWAAEIAKLMIDDLGVFKSAKNIKFKKMILPNEKIDLILILNTIKKTVAFTYKNNDEIYSAGSFLFEYK